MGFGFRGKRHQGSLDSQISIVSSKIKDEKTRRVIGVISGKGGVGKTVVAANLGLAINELGVGVTIVDADVTASNLGLHLGTFSFSSTLQDVLNRKATLEKATYVTSTGLMIIPSSIALGSIKANLSKLGPALKNLEGLVIVDCPPGMDSSSLSVIDACDEVIIVATPDIPSITNAAKTVQLATRRKKDVLGLVLNRCRNDRYEMSPHEIEEMTGAEILAVIPEDHEMRKSLYYKTPIVFSNPYSKASVELKFLASRIVRKKYQPGKFVLAKRMIYSLRT